MRGAVTIGRVGGVPIRVHFTLLLVLPFLAFGFSRAFLLFRESASVAGIPPELVRGAPLAWGFALTIALLASVVVHELAHTRYAIRNGGAVHDITLFMIGGVSNVAEAPEGHRHEALLALVGPLASLALAAAFWGAHLALGAVAPSLFSLRFAAVYLAAMNLALGLFNLVPAFPMDGGRVLRAALAARLGLPRATAIAAGVGKALALVFFVGGLLGGSLILAVIAVFVWIGADAEARHVRARAVLGERPVADFLRPHPAPLAAGATMGEAAARMRAERRGALVAMDGPHLLGVVARSDVERAARRSPGAAVLGALVRPAPQVDVGARAWDAFRLLLDRKLPLLPVVADGHLVGVIDRDALAEALAPAPAAARRVLAPRERVV